MGYTTDTQVLRMCAKAYQRQPETRVRLALRLAIHRAIACAEPGMMLRLRDQQGAVYSINATMIALNRLSARLRIQKPGSYLRLTEVASQERLAFCDSEIE